MLLRPASRATSCVSKAIVSSACVSVSSLRLLLINLVTTHVLHLRSLLLAHLPAPLWKSLIALFGMLHLVYGMNSPLIFASLVRYSLLHFHLSHMAVHHLHRLHYHRLHLLLLAQYFILNSRLGSLANPFLHRPLAFLPDWFHGLSEEGAGRPTVIPALSDTFSHLWAQGGLPWYRHSLIRSWLLQARRVHRLLSIQIYDSIWKTALMGKIILTSNPWAVNRRSACSWGWPTNPVN